MNREGKRCFLYSRVSTEMQVEGYSLEAQKNCLKKFAEREEIQIVDYSEDAGKSGKSIEGRPAFKKMLSDIESGKKVWTIFSSINFLVSEEMRLTFSIRWS